MSRVRVICPSYSSGELIMAGEFGASKLQGDPVAITQEILKVSQGVKNMLVLHSETTGWHNKLENQYIDLASLPANARIVRVSLEFIEATNDGSLIGNAFKLVSSESDNDFVTQASNANISLSGAEILPFTRWVKNTVSSTLQLKVIGGNVVGAESGDIIACWVEYVQE
jgi:hypothetical protein